MENKEKQLFGITPPPVEEKTQGGAEKNDVDNRYKVYGQNIYVADKEIIEYYQMSAKLLCFANLLVGRFDDKGNYIIQKEIKRDLVAMDKEVSDEGPAFFKATNVYMKKNFYYYISLSKTAEGKGKASLYLYEYVGDFMDKEFISSHVADFVDELDSAFKDKVRHSFNLVDVDIPNDDRTTPSLAVLMQKMLDEQLRSVELLEMACQVYILRVLKNFEKSAQGKKIVEKFKQELAKISKGKLSYIKQKALLDRIVNGFGGYETLDVDQQTLQTLMQELTKTYNDTVTRRAVVEAISPEKKEEKKGGAKSAAKKPAAKKAGGGDKKPAKKAAGKKADKKDEKKKGGGVTIDKPEKKDDKKKDSSIIDKVLKKIVTVQDVFNQHLKGKEDNEERNVPVARTDNHLEDDAEELEANSKKGEVQEDEDDAEELKVSLRRSTTLEDQAGKMGQGLEDEDNDAKYKGLTPEEIEKLKAEEFEKEKLSKMTPKERAEYQRQKAEMERIEEQKRRKVQKDAQQNGYGEEHDNQADANEYQKEM